AAESNGVRRKCLAAAAERPGRVAAFLYPQRPPLLCLCGTRFGPQRESTVRAGALGPRRPPSRECTMTVRLTERLVHRLAQNGGELRRGTPRRGFLAGAALTGAAIAASPIGYFTRPASAAAAPCRPGPPRNSPSSATCWPL